MLLIGILILILVIALMAEKLPWSFFNRIVALIILFSSIFSFNTFNTIYSGITLYNSLWQITSLNISFSTFILIIGGLALLLTEGPLSKEKNENNIKPEYSLIITLSIIGMISLIHSYDLITLFLSIELQSLSLYVLATIFKESESATSAGLKYFLLGGLSSSFILLGSSLLYGFTGMTNFETFYIISNVEYDDITLAASLIVALFILLAGLLFKIAAAPFHNWAPDVYDGVPTLVTSWLAILPKISIFIIMIEIFSNIFYQFYSITIVIILSSFLSLIFGSILGLSQYRIKRLLAFSSISHVGFLLLSLSSNSYQSIESLIFYLIQYTITILTVFYILIAFGYILPTNNKKSILTLSQLKGSLINNTLLAWSFAICLFSMAGIPPCIGFFGKFFILLSTFNAPIGLNFMILIAILTSVISTVYYLKIIKIIHFDSIWNINYKNNYNSSLNLVFSNALVISIFSLIIMLFILNPNSLINLIHIISLTQIS
jgi:NADH-ubiquinone oxidoreductase chain 2